MDAAVIIIVLVALIVGGALGWLWASREAAGARQTVENLRLQLDEVVKERDVEPRRRQRSWLRSKPPRWNATRGFEARIKELIEAKEALSAQFAEISNKLLAEAQDSFLKRADQRFRQSEESAART